MTDIIDFDADFEDPPQLTGILQFTDDKQKLKLSREYIIKKKIGEGGMGEVNLASTYLFGDEQLVAVKILDKKDMPSEDSLKRFQRETQLLMLAKHNNIVKFIDYWESALYAYLIMEYVDGTDLENYVEEHGPFKPNEIINLLMPILDALVYMNEEYGMHHRDIKPNNIQLLSGEQSKAMLIDFGNAKIDKDKEQKRSLTMISGQMSGTPGYIAPEVSMDNYTEKDDVFSMACTLMYCLLGKNPFEVRGDFFASFRKIQENKLDLGKYENTMIGHWIHINTSYNRAERMTLRQAFHSLERMVRNKSYPMQKVDARLVEVMGSDKALMQLISREAVQSELNETRQSRTGAFDSLETTNPENGPTNLGVQTKQAHRHKTKPSLSNEAQSKRRFLFVATGLTLFVVVLMAISALVIIKKKNRNKIKGNPFQRNAVLIHRATKLPYYLKASDISNHANQIEARKQLLSDADIYFDFARKHEDKMAYEQAKWRWKAVLIKSPSSDPLKVLSLKKLYHYYCSQKNSTELKKLKSLYHRLGEKSPLSCKTQ